MPKTEKRKKSQEKIEQAFLQLVQSKEVNRISVTEICKLAGLNRSSFYANYLDVYDLVDKIREWMVKDYASIFHEKRGNSRENYLKLFTDVKKRPDFYRTYFKLGFDQDYKIVYYDKKLANQFFDDKYIDYHTDFFKAGITAILKKWLAGGCQESAEEMMSVIESEYQHRVSGKETYGNQKISFTD
ncbi:TetR/AcrR family transcriptional regulator [Lactobacillus nasalidis]|uniref:TetR/AcrR family transcriptional regulator n=1 Tax=Lactobacillus nasalidis TaxID=2797258 RepID=UPI0019163591|nr:TetR/AcrR family transcriptional regulator [Lactobacillus nasalidis]GHV97286.1 TetR family transcriptional regulator [Lactobacillus nasalidis]GHW00039.1 TetR family transcriptional regulator [Lactobacillus nasalidis]